MTEKEFAALQKASATPTLIKATDLGPENRTLLYGYTTDRYTWHVYLDSGKIHRLVYRGDELLAYLAMEDWAAESLVPDKRVYPESTDRLFAELLRERNTDVPYLPFNRDREREWLGVSYHGKTRDWDFHGV